MKMEQVRIDALANNLANVNSTGFRQILTRVAQVGTTAATQDAEKGQAPGQTQVQNQGDNWPKDTALEMYHAVDVRSGPVTSTGRETDVAIVGRGFFVAKTENGDRYTRAGSFRLDEQKQLVTPDGHPILGEGGAIKLDGESFAIENDGTVMVNGAVVNKLRVVDFADPGRLEHEGNNLLMAPEEMAAQNLPADQVAVAQGHLEGSNVNPIDTLVAMISAQRAFEVQTKVMTTEDEMLSKAVNNLPRVG